MIFDEEENSEPEFTPPLVLDYEEQIFKRWPDLRVPQGEPGEYYFDSDAAYNAVCFFINELHHTEGPKKDQKLELEPWQQYIVEQIFGWKKQKDGLRRFREIFIFIPRKNGKALHIKTPILTTKGWKKMGNIQVGDFVFGQDGKPTRVKAVTEIQENRPCYRLTFSCGEVIVADENHEWHCRNKSSHTVIIKTTKQIAEEQQVQVLKVARCMEFKKNSKLPLSAEDLALLLCRTHANALRVHNIDDFALREDIIGGRIPHEYFISSRKQRVDLMNALLDLDGWLGQRGFCEFITRNKALAANVSTLLFTLGINNHIQVKEHNFTVLIKCYRDDGLFKNFAPYYRKRLRKRPPPQHQIQNCRFLEKVEYFGEESVKCIEVSNEDNMFVAGHNLVPTHNSFIGAGLALLALYALNEPGARVISAAADTDQAALIYNTAKQIVEENPRLSEGCHPLRKAMTIPELSANYQVISADAHTKHGKNLSAVIVDELHAIPGRDLVDVLFTSVGARSEPLKIMLTTAGFDKQSLCYELYEHAKRVIRDWNIDPEFFPVIFEADAGDDWKEEATWYKANPNLGVSISLDYFKSEMRKALERPAYENTFKRLHLNQWTTTETRWVPQEVWDACGSPLNLEELKGRDCYIGADLASKTDLTAFVLIFPFFDVNEQIARLDVLPYFWMPSDNIELRRKRDRVDYGTWVNQGFIETTPGVTTDYDRLRVKINELGEIYRIRQIAFDPWNALQLMGQLEGDGFNVISVNQSFAHLSGPTKELEALCLSQKIRHGGNPVLKWMFGNIGVDTDASGNIKISRKTSREKIDGMAALVLAVHCLLGRERDEVSVYESRGVRTF